MKIEIKTDFGYYSDILILSNEEMESKELIDIDYIKRSKNSTEEEEIQPIGTFQLDELVSAIHAFDACRIKEREYNNYAEKV